MVAIVSGNSLGLSLTSLATLGANGTIGQASEGRGGELAYVNIANGNLVLRDQDDYLSSVGADINVLRTYNSQGRFNDDNGDNWSVGVFQSPLTVTGTLNSSGSQIVRTDRDGAQSTFTWNGSAYVSTAGAGAYDTMTVSGSTIVWTDGDTGNKEVYANSGSYRLLSSSDTSGNTLSYYYVAGVTGDRLASVQSSSGARVDYVYSAAGLLTSLQRSDSSGLSPTTSTRYTYDGNNRLATVTVDLTPNDSSIADGHVYQTTYTYVGTSKEVASITQSDGSVTSFSYVNVGGVDRIASVTDPLGQVTSYSYDTTNRTTTVTDPLNNRTIYGYDASGQLTSIATPGADGTLNTTTYKYDSAGNLTSMVDARGSTVMMQYDENGNQISQVNGAGDTITRTYDIHNQLLTETIQTSADSGGIQPMITVGTVSSGMTTNYVYDAAGKNQLRFVVSPEGRVTEYRYNAAGQRVSTIVYEKDLFVATPPDTFEPLSPDSSMTTSSIIVGDYIPPSYTESSLTGWAANLDDPSAISRTDLQYDARGNLASTTAYANVDPATGAGIVDGKEVKTTTVYDPRGQLISVYSPANGTTSYAYDGLGRQISATDALNHSTVTQYDDANNRTTVTMANGLSTVSTYDRAGRLISVANSSDGAITRYAYDADGRLVMQVLPTGQASWMLYDAAGNRVADIDANGSLTEYVYNQDNQLTEQINYATKVDTSRLVSASGAPLDPQLSAIRPAATANDQKTWRAYDVAGRLAAVVDPTGAVTVTTYDNAGRVDHVTQYTNRISTAALGSKPSLSDVLNLAAPVINVTGSLQVVMSTPVLHRVTLQYYGTVTITNQSASTIKAPVRFYLSGLTAGVTLTDATGLDNGVPYIDYDDQIDPGQSVQFSTTFSDPSNVAFSYTPTFVTIPTPPPSRQQRNFYDNDGRLIGTRDADGYLKGYVYDAAGQLVRELDYTAPVPSTDWNDYDFTTLAGIAGASVQTLHVYNNLGQLAGTVDPDNHVTEYVYDGAGNRTRTIRYANTTANPGGSTMAAVRPASSSQDQVTSATYDALNRVATQTDAYGTVTTFAYDAMGNVTSQTTAAGTSDARTVTARYDLLGRLTGQLDGEGSALLTGNQTQAQIDAIFARYGTTYTYDAAGRRTSATDPSGARTLYFYDADSHLTQVVNALGEVQESRYNALNQLVGTTAYATRIDPASLGNGGVLTDAQAAQFAALRNVALDSSATITYDAAGRVATSTDALGNLTSHGYDAFGNEIVRSTAIDPHTTLVQTFAYDQRGQLISEDDDVGGVNATTTRTYDAFGRVISSTDANGQQTIYQRDSLGRVIDVRSPAGEHQSTSYDAFGRVVTTTDGAGNTTSYSYDLATRTTVVTSPENVVMRTVRNRDGDVQSVTDGDGNVTRYVYNRDGNLTDTILPIGATHADYDSAGRVVDTVDADGNTVAYTYDAANRVLTRTVDPSGLRLVTSYVYDAKGEQIQVTDPSQRVTRFEYDLDGNVARQIVDPNGLNLVTVFTHDANGHELTMTTPDGRSVRYVYDALGRRTEEHVDPNGLNLTTLYRYDQDGNVVAKTDADNQVTRYAYDADDRLAYTVDPMGNVVHYQYDGDGRQTVVVSYAQPISLGGWGLAVSAADVQARIVATPQDNTVRSFYDKDGNRTFAVDATGAVTQWRHDGNGNVTESVSYATRLGAGWNGSDTPVPTADPAHDSDTRIGYDAMNRAIYSVDADGDVTTMRYDNNGNLVERVSYANRIDLASWDKHSMPAPVADPARDVHDTMVYDAAGRMIYSVDGAGGLTAISYNADGQVTGRVAYAHAIPAGTPLTKAGLAAAALSIADNAHDVRTTQLFDAAGRLTWSVDGRGAVVHNVYDGSGNLVSRTAYANAIAPGALPSDVVASSADRTVRMAYDGAGRIAYQSDALGAVTQFTYDGQGNVLTRTAYATPIATTGVLTLAQFAQFAQASADPAHDREWRMTYDADGRQSLQVNPEGAVTETRYDAFGNAIATIAYAGTVPLNLLSATPTYAEIMARVQPDPMHDRVTRSMYDAGGNLVYVVDADGYVTRTDYDGAGRATDTTSYRYAVPAGATTLAAVAAAVVPDALDEHQHVNYDGAGHVVSTTDAQGASEHFTYDGVGNKLSYTDRNNATWTYEYDSAGRMVREHAPAVSVTSLAVTSGTGGDPGLAIDAAHSGMASIVTQIAYDALGNVVSRTEALGRPEQRTTTYEYDAAGNQVKVTFPPVGVYDQNADPLTLNGANGFAARVEDQVTLYSQVTYNLFGEAVANRDVAGNMSYKAYDKAGRLSYDIDAEGYVSGYQRNVFGDVTTFTRYAGKISLNASAQASSAVEVGAALQGIAHDADRTIVSTYDRLGRAVQVVQPQTFIFDGSNYFNVGKTTRMTYDAFGNVVQTSELKNPVANTWANTYAYFDRAGRKTATVDAMGWLTTDAYDANGNVVAHTEYANATTSASTAGYTMGPASADDRLTTYTYSLNNLVTSETMVNVEFSVRPDGTSTGGDVTTSYGYDAVGNQVQVRDANGAVTSTQYDAMGRATMVVSPARRIDGVATPVSPVTQFRRDAYGNVVARIDYAVGPDAPSANDRVTLTRYDNHGHAVQSQDANGNDTYSSYDASGNLAKQWKTVTGNDGTSQTMFTQYRYDKLGNQVDAITAAPTAETITTSLNQSVVSASYAYLVDPNGGAVTMSVDYIMHDRSLPYDWDDGGGDGGGEQDVDAYGSTTVSAAAAATSLSIDLGEDMVDGQSVGSVTRITIYQADANGVMHQLWQSAGDAPLGTYGLTMTQAAAGVTDTHMEYDAFGDLTRKGVDGGRQEYYDYDNAGNMWRTNSGDGVVKVSLFDADGNATAAISGLTVDLSGVANEQQASSLAGVRRVDTRYDLLGRVVAQTESERDGARPVVSQRTDRWGNVIEMTDPRSAYIKTVYTYNARNELLETSLPDAAGNQSADSTVEYNYYDALGRKVATRDGDGNVNGSVYDDGGNLVQELHADGGVVNYGYDAFGERVSTTDAMQNTTRFEFDKVGNLKVIYQPDETTIRYTYDQANRQLTMTNGASETISYKYDLNGNVIETTQPMGEQSWTIFNALNQKIAEVDANHKGMTWSLDYFGQVQTHVDLARVTTFYEYDGVTRQLMHMYNGRGQNIYYAYDDAGQLKQINDLGVGQVTTYHYDAAGNRIYEGVVGAATYESNNVLFDAQNRITDIYALDDIHLHIDYDKAGNRLHETVGSGSGAVANQSLWYAYDSMNRQVLVDGAVNGNVNDLSNLVLGQGHIVTYDLSGNRTSDTQFTDRIVQHDSNALDESGNAVVMHQFTTDHGIVKQSYAFDSMNRVSVVSNQTFKADSNGNVTQGAESAILDIRRYDGAGRVLSTGLLPGLDTSLAQGYVDALASTGAGVGTTHRINSYDHDGRLIDQQVFDTTSANASAPVPVGVSMGGWINSNSTDVAAIQAILAADPTANASNNAELASIEANGLAKAISDATARAAYLHDEAAKAGAAFDKAVAYAAGLPDGDPNKQAAIDKANAIKAIADKLDADAAAEDQKIVDLNATPTGGVIYMVYSRNDVATSDIVGAPANFKLDNEIVYHFDDVGNVTSYSATVEGDPGQNNGFTSTYNYSYQPFDEYKDQNISGSRSDGGNGGDSYSTYDANGNLSGVTDTTKGSNSRTFINDANGMVLEKDQEGEVLHQIVVGGQVYGTYGRGTDPNKPLNDDGTENYVDQTNFNIGYRAVDSNYPTATSGSYVVQAGDTLQSIAQQAYGDSQLWYLIADANGVSGNLHAGTTLILPNKLGGIHNDAGEFRAYDSDRIIGDKTPNLPAPAPTQHGGDSGGGDCGGLGQILIIAVAIVVTAYTAGAALGAMGATASTATAGELAVAGAIGGAVGSVASQAVGIATGMQDGFSWKAVAMGAIQNAVGMELQGVDLSSSQFMNAAARSAIGNIATQGVEVMTGLQHKFNWTAVAASSIGAGIGAEIGGLFQSPGATSAPGIGTQIAQQTVANIGSGVTSALISGSGINMREIAVDAFGNALGESFVPKESVVGVAETPSAPASPSFSDSINRGPDWLRNWQNQHPDFTDDQGAVSDMVPRPADDGASTDISHSTDINSSAIKSLRLDTPAGVPFASKDTYVNLPKGGLTDDQLDYLTKAVEAKGGLDNLTDAQLDDIMDSVKRSVGISTSQIQQANAGLSYVNGLGLRPLAAANDPHTYYVPIVFDGTDNNKNAMAFPTNPGIFSNSLFNSAMPNVLDPLYETGLGTGPEGAIMGGAFGAGGKDRESHAMNKLSENMATIYANDPDAKVIIVGVGFSRGAAELRDFANQVYQGVPIPGTMDATTGQSMTYSGSQTPRFGAMVIYDTVGSFGIAGTNINVGYNLNIAPNVEHVLSITANDEGRLFFPLSSATDSVETGQPTNDGRIVQIGMPGVHSNIGGGYPGSYQYYSLDMGYSFLTQLGVPMNSLKSPNGQYDYDVTHYSTSSMRLQNSNWSIDNILQGVGLESKTRTVYPSKNPPLHH